MSEKFLYLKDGTKICFKEVIKNPDFPLVIVTHGVGEHFRRHLHFESLLEDLDINLFLYDLRGHGKSDGRRAYVQNFASFMQDLNEIADQLANRGLKDVIFFGHSMGALITSAYIARYQTDKLNVKGVILSAPPIGVSGILGKIINNIPAWPFRFFSKILMSIEVKGLVDLRYLSHDPQVLNDYLKDHLNSVKLHTRLLFNLVSTSKKIFKHPIASKVKSYVFFGEKDQIIDVPSVKKYFNTIETGFNVTEIKNGFHELHNEIPKIKDDYLFKLKNAFIELLSNNSSN